MEANESSRSTVTAASLATSVPETPIATPMSACLRAGASLAPSPVTATTSPRRCRATTTRILSSGPTRHSSSSPGLSRSKSRPSSSSASTSVPVTTVGAGPVTMPTLRATASAVSGWSPVTITIRMRARRQSATAPLTSGRGGSSIPTRPSSVSSDSAAFCPGRGSGTCRWATARTRSPWEAIASFAAMTSARRSSVSRRRSPARSAALQRSRSSCGAPLAYTRQPPPALSWCTVLMSLRPEPKGCSATRGAAASSAARSSPAFAAATSSAPSVVSPSTRQPARFDGGTSRALQHRAAARSRARTGAGSSTSPSGAYPTPVTACATPADHTRTTVISARVRVPVLSVHTTVVDPSASTASSCLTRACRRAIRRTPIARDTDMVAGRPSGTRVRP